MTDERRQETLSGHGPTTHQVTIIIPTELQVRLFAFNPPKYYARRTAHRCRQPMRWCIFEVENLKMGAIVTDPFDKVQHWILIKCGT